MDLSLLLVTRAVAKRIVRGRRDAAVDLPWADGYPLEGDKRACIAYLGQLPVMGGPSRSSPFGYYQIVVSGEVVGGIGFHGPPNDDLVEVGYGVVQAMRRQGIASEALKAILGFASGLDGVARVRGRTSPDNLASQGVMVGAGMQLVGRDADFLHYEIEIQSGCETAAP